MPVTVTDDSTKWDATWARVAQLDGAGVEAGLFDPDEAQKGARAELGTRDIKARPWMSKAGDSGQAKILRAAGKAVKAVADGMPAHPALTALGTVVADLELEIITSGRVGGPKLKPSTVDRKGHPAKLVDSGDMVEHLDVEVTLP